MDPGWNTDGQGDRLCAGGLQSSPGLVIITEIHRLFSWATHTKSIRSWYCQSYRHLKLTAFVEANSVLKVKMVLELLTRLAATPTTNNETNVNTNNFTNAFNITNNTNAVTGPSVENQDLGPSIEEPSNVSNFRYNQSSPKIIIRCIFFKTISIKPLVRTSSKH